jgi:uncharacterized membrane protein YfhO
VENKRQREIVYRIPLSLLAPLESVIYFVPLSFSLSTQGRERKAL